MLIIGIILVAVGILVPFPPPTKWVGQLSIVIGIICVLYWLILAVVPAF